MKEIIASEKELAQNDAYRMIKDLCKPFDEVKYDNMPLSDIAMYAINLLHENGITLEHEKMVIAIYNCFPQKFCLQGFEGFPDAARISRTILQLNPKYKEPPVGWVEGTPTKGYSITDKGFKGAEKAEKELFGEVKDSTARKQRKQLKRSKFDKQSEQIRGTIAFEKFENGATTLSGPEFFRGINRADFESKSTILRVITDLKESAQQIDDQEIVDFLKFAEKIYLEEIA